MKAVSDLRAEIRRLERLVVSLSLEKAELTRRLAEYDTRAGLACGAAVGHAGRCSRAAGHRGDCGSRLAAREGR